MRGFNKGDIIYDPRDGERGQVIGYSHGSCELRIITPGNGGPTGVWTRRKVGEIVRRPSGDIDNYKLDESYRVQLILNRYEV